MRRIEATQHPTTRHLVQDALEKCGYVFDPLSGWKVTGAPIHEYDSPSLMSGKVREYLEQTKSDYVPAKDAIIASIELIEHSQLSAYTRKCCEDLKYDQTVKDTSEELAKLFAGENYHSSYPSVIRQILWSVKNKMLGNQVMSPIMAIFYGTAGVGKSTMVRALCGPLPAHKYAFIKSGDSLVNSEKHTQLLADNLVIHLDEMSGMKQADIAKLKSMDAPYLSFVPLYTNTVRRVFNSATLIGCSNTQVRNLLHATGNVRKWVQLDFYTPPSEDRETFTRERIKGLMEFDYRNLWRSVNEHGTEPFSDPKVYDEFRKYVEETSTSSTPTTDWLDEYIENYSGEWINKFSLYKLYKERCETETKHMSKDNFYELCEQKGFKEKKKPGSGDRGYAVPLKKEEEVF